MELIRPLLTTYAYNILGSYESAQDIVQDAYLKFNSRDNSHVEDVKAYLVRTVINLSINLKNKQKREVKNYTGQWLPEPVAAEEADAAIKSKELLSYSLMVLLEKLNTKQRAVFILKEAFDYPHEEIAEVLNMTVDNARKTFSRAKEQLAKSKKIDKEITNKAPADYIKKYMDVIRTGDVKKLEQLLHDDVVVISDGGGKVAAFMNPITGKPDVSALLLGLYKKFYSTITLKAGMVNHDPALFYYEGDKLVNCQVFALDANGNIEGIYFVRNPDKLQQLQNNPGNLSHL